MRVLQLISSSGFFGAENVLLNLGRLLKEHGNNPYLICLKNASKHGPEVHLQAQKQGLPSRVISCRHRLDIKVIKRIKDFIKQERIEVIHSHGYKSNFYGLIASKLSGVPIVATLHGWIGETKKSRFYEKLDKWIIRRMNHLVAVSPMICEELADLKLNGTPSTFVANGVDTEKFNPNKVIGDVRKEFGLGDSLVIGAVGRLSQEKGHSYLINAFKNIYSQLPSAKLLIVGDGPLRDSLQPTVHSPQLKDKVIFAGKRDNLPAIYKSMDIFVLPSLKEGLPLVLLEAMSMRLPVIATKVGGIPYVMNKDEGILVSPGNIEELKSSILLLLKDSSLRRRMGEKAREKILSCFSLRSFYQKYIDIYKNVITV